MARTDGLTELMARTEVQRIMDRTEKERQTGGAAVGDSSRNMCNTRFTNRAVDR